MEKISKLFEEFDLICAYIHDILVITDNDLLCHLKYLEKLLHKIVEAGLKVKASKSFFDA